MKKILISVLAGFALGGCAMPARVKEAERHGYERAMREIVRERYWQTQEAQRNPSMPRD